MDSCAELRKARKVWLEAGKSMALLVLLGMSAPVAAQPTDSTLPVARPLTAAERAALWQQWRDKGSLKPISVTVPAIDLPAQFLDAKSIAVPVVSSLPKRLVEVTELNAQASLTQARSYASIDDPRAVAMLDEYAAVLTKRPHDEVVAADQANSLLEAARFYRQLGEGKKAVQVYAQISAQGFGWATGMALYDQAIDLIDKARHEEARKLLRTPVTGQHAEQIKVVMLWGLAKSHYQTGEWEEAKRYSQAVIDQYQSLEHPMQGEGLQQTIKGAQKTLEMSLQWIKEPIVVAPRLIDLQVEPSQAKPIPQWLFIGVPQQDVPLQISCPNPLVKIHWPKNQAEDESDQADFGITKEVKVEIAAEAFQQGINATITISSPQFPKFKAQIPLRIQPRKP